MKQCRWCDNPFQTDVSYQIYCSPECRKEATREKIAERHKVLKRKSRKNKTRFCAGGCGAVLSMYNDSNMCDHCYISAKTWSKVMKEIKGMMHEYEDDTK